VALTTDQPAARTAPARDQGWAGVAGLLAAALALGAAQLMAGIAASVTGPVIAVGDLVVRNAPGTTSQSAVESVGRADKPLLLAGVVAVWALVGWTAGRLAARQPMRGYILFGTVALVAGLAAWREPQAALLPVVVATALATATGLGAMWLLLVKARARAEPAVGDEPAARIDRRRFLGLAAAVGGAAAATALIGRHLADRMSVAAARAAVILPRARRVAPPPAPSAKLAVDGISPLVTPNDAFYRIDTALSLPNVDPARWNLHVTGMVAQPFELTYDELLALPMVEEYVTMCCVSNEVGGDLIGNAAWLGVPLADVLGRAGVDANASQIVGRSVDGFTVGFPTSVGLDGRVALVAVGMNGEPLPIRHGFPARLVVAGLYGYVSGTKWLEEIELTTLDAFDAYWVPRGWSKQAPIKTQSRIDVARPSTSTHGAISVAGVAWAPVRGVSQVEVRLDDGEWQPARLATSLGDETWRQWIADLPAASGRHVVRVRATDGTGEVQTAAVSPPAPNGATGYHTVSVDLP
jgi:DMSO/TMAO reductase YedYZ molybdopterin-dependent catalytic subunit